MDLSGLNINRNKLKRWFGLLTTFLVGQGATQIIRLASGFLIIRWLTKDDYATFTLVLAVQGVTSVLTDLGFSGGVMALIGNRCDEPKVVARYIAVAQHYRNRLVLAGAAILAVVIFLLSQRYEWSIMQASVFWFVIVITLWSEAQASFYSPILLLQQRIRASYTIDVVFSSLRLLLLFIFFLAQSLVAWVALVIGAVQAFFSAVATMFVTRRNVSDFPDIRDLQTEKKEALDLTLPKIPGVVFYAFQGQVTVFLIGAFGQYSQIADIGALSKIALLFSLPGAFANALIVPWFARLPLERVLRNYYAVLGTYLSFGIVLGLFTWFFPQIFLLILGQGYQGLEFELFLFSVSSSLGLLSGLGYKMTSVRKWVFYWSGPTAIAFYCSMLILFIFMVDLSSVANVIMLSIINNIFLILLNQTVFFFGYNRKR